MTKSDIIREITSQTGIESQDVRTVVEAFLSNVRTKVIQGESIHFRRFGSFTTKTRARKIGRNISANTSLIIAAHNIPYFKPAKEFSQEVRKLPVTE